MLLERAKPEGLAYLEADRAFVWEPIPLDEAHECDPADELIDERRTNPSELRLQHCESG
jgi:hypothetical protein